MLRERFKRLRGKFAKEPATLTQELPPHEMVGAEFSIYTFDQHPLHHHPYRTVFASEKLVRIPGIQELLPITFDSISLPSSGGDERDAEHARRLIKQPSYFAPFIHGHGTELLDDDIFYNLLQQEYPLSFNAYVDVFYDISQNLHPEPNHAYTVPRTLEGLRLQLMFPNNIMFESRSDSEGGVSFSEFYVPGELAKGELRLPDDVKKLSQIRARFVNTLPNI